MSFWTDIRDGFEQVISGGMYDPAARRQQAEMMRLQTEAFKKQTEIAKQQLEEAKRSEDAQARRLQQKQIRSLRGGFSYDGGSSSLGDSSKHRDDIKSNLGD